MTVPAGAGVTGYIGKHATVDVRGTYRFIPDNGITEMGTGILHQWTAQAHVGWLVWSPSYCSWCSQVVHHERMRLPHM